MTTDTPPSALDAAEARLNVRLIRMPEYTNRADDAGQVARAYVEDVTALRAQLAEARAERDEARALATEYIRQADAMCRQTKSSLHAEIVATVDAVLNCANGRWGEWGGRAEDCEAILLAARLRSAAGEKR